MAKVYSKELVEGKYRFIAVVTWTGQDDKIAAERFSKWFQMIDDPQNPGNQIPEILKNTGIDYKTAQGYYLTAARTFMLIGYIQSQITLAKDPNSDKKIEIGGPTGLQRFCARMINGTAIQANFYHAVDTEELQNVFQYLW